jgi:hypothetical protein
LLTLIKEGICQEENNHLVKFAHILKFKIELNMKRFNIKSKHAKLMTENNNSIISVKKFNPIGSDSKK